VGAGTTAAELRQTYRGEAEMGIQVLKLMNESEGLTSFKIFPLYFIASKSREL
jgi:hypothetical protein